MARWFVPCICMVMLVLSLLCQAGGSTFVGVVAAYAPTHECGSLSSDTTWTTADGPYQLDCSVLVPSGVTLTIAPGVVINGVGTGPAMLQIGGKLVANGTAASPITFTWAGPCCTQENGVRFTSGADPSSSVSYVDISGAHNVALQNYPGSLLDHISLHDNPNYGAELSVPTSGGQPGSLTIDHSYFGHNGIGLEVSPNSGQVTINSSTITDNQMGLYFIGPFEQPFSVTGNNITNNSQWNIEPVGTTPDSYSIDASNNWWGMTSVSAIRATVDDCQQDLTHPCVAVEPPSSAVVAGAPAGPLVPSSSSATATSLPTATPTSVPLPTSTTAPTATSTPTSVPTSTSIPTSAPTASPTPSATPTPLPLATQTVTATTFSLPTATASPRPIETMVTLTASPTAPASSAPVIDKVMILRSAHGHQQDTRSLSLREKPVFALLSHLIASGSVPKAALSISVRGKVVAHYTMGVSISVNQSRTKLRYSKAVTLKNRRWIGTAYAHFSLTLAHTTVRRDRKFSLKPST